MQPRFSASEMTGAVTLLLEARPSAIAWENKEAMSSPWTNLRSERLKATYIACLILKRGHASAENTDECLGILEKESQRLNKLLTNFLDFARPRLPRYQQVDPAVFIESVASIARHSAILHDVELVVDHRASLHSIVMPSS